MNKKFTTIFLFFIVILFSGCSNQKANNSAMNEISYKEYELYIEISALDSQDYFYDHKLGLKKAEEELGVRTEYMAPREYDINSMIAFLEQAIAKKPKGIILVGFDPALNSMVKKAMDAGIPVVTVDSDLPDSGRIAFVGTDNINAGKKGGEKLAELIGKKGKVAIITKIGQQNLEERVLGYKEALSKYPDIEIIDIIDTKSDSIIAAQEAAKLLDRHPDISGIVCLEAAGSSGVVPAIKNAKLAGKVKIIAMDRGNDVLKYIEDDVISATLVQKTALMPYYAMHILYDLNNSNINITSNDLEAKVRGTVDNIDTGIIVVDKSNVQYFKR